MLVKFHSLLGKFSKCFDIYFNKSFHLNFCNGTLLVQGNLPRVLPVKIYKYASCLIPYIDLFFFLCGEWSSLVFKDLQKYFLSLMFFFCFPPLKDGLLVFQMMNLTYKCLKLFRHCNLMHLAKLY